jgi:hypothetical protein
MSVISALAWVESTALSQWIVGSLWAFPVILTLHAIGMGFAVGLSAMVDLRILGVGRAIPIPELRRFLPVLWAGFWLNAASGVLLLIGYPTKALTNPVFYLKLTLIAAGMVLLTRIARTAFAGTPAPQEANVERDRRLRRLAMVSLVCWTAAITAGRLLAYTYTYLTAGDY